MPSEIIQSNGQVLDDSTYEVPESPVHRGRKQSGGFQGLGWGGAVDDVILRYRALLFFISQEGKAYSDTVW